MKFKKGLFIQAGLMALGTLIFWHHLG